MRHFKSLMIIHLALFFLFTPNLLADIVSLKSGRNITVDETWEQNGKIICSIRGATVSFDSNDVLSVKSTHKKQLSSKNGFKFDVWHSGISIHEILAIAKKHDIPLHKKGLISINKKYNPAMSRKYAATATQYYYKTQLLGKYATVDLFLTPSSKRLHKLSIRWNHPNRKDGQELEKEVMNNLEKKYGRLQKHNKEILGQKYYWSPTPHVSIEMLSSSSGVSLVYKDIDMAKLLAEEKNITKSIKKANYQKTDMSKF